jgi:hypothetical protein
MAEYKLIVGGFGFDGSAHVLTDVEVHKLRDSVKEKGVESLVDLYSDLPKLLDNYNYVGTNYWTSITALADDNTVFSLYDGDENLIWEATFQELTPTFDEDCGFDFADDLERNINKLKLRFPDKFTEEKALNRDLDGERKILEG